MSIPSLTLTGKPNGPRFTRGELIDIAQLLVGLATLLAACGVLR